MRLLHAGHADVVRAAARVLQRWTDDELRDALGGNICRCTGYEHIVEAVRLAGRRYAERDFAVRDAELPAESRSD